MIDRASLPEAPSTGWRRIRRVLASVLVVVATGFVGVLLGEYFSGLVRDSHVQKVFGVPVKWGLAGVGLTYLLASLEKVLRVANTFREYIARPDKKVSLYPECVALAFIIAYLTVLARVLSPGETLDPNPATAMSGTPKELVYLTRLPDGGPAPIEYCPFLFDLAVGPSNWSVGTTLNEQQVNDLRRLVLSLKACVGTGPGQDVEIDVRGYADRNEFASNSDELNRQTANRRAAGVHTRLKSLIGSQDGPSRMILRNYVEWPRDDPRAMTRERYFAMKTLRETGNGKDQGLFNRRADVLILRIGACERLAAK